MEIVVGDITIKYDVIRSNRKSLGIQVTSDQQIIARSPYSLTDEQVNQVVRKKAGWILDKLEYHQEVKPEPASKEYLSGEKLLYLGRRYRLQVRKSNSQGVQVKLLQGKFHIDVGSDINGTMRQEVIQNQLEEWYKEHGRVKFQQRVHRYKKQLGVEPQGIRVKAQQRLWGSCSSKGNLNFNWKLIMAPISVVDYVVVHELVHLLYPNHTDDYWSTVKSIIPDYEEKKEWLRIHGKELRL